MHHSHIVTCIFLIRKSNKARQLMKKKCSFLQKKGLNNSESKNGDHPLCECVKSVTQVFKFSISAQFNLITSFDTWYLNIKTHFRTCIFLQYLHLEKYVKIHDSLINISYIEYFLIPWSWFLLKILLCILFLILMSNVISLLLTLSTWSAVLIWKYEK